VTEIYAVEVQRPWRQVAVPFSGLSADKLITTLKCRIIGWNFDEDTGSASATIDVYDGANTSGIRIARVDTPTGQSKDFTFSPPYYPTLGGIYINVTSGTISGTIYMEYQP